MKTTTDKKPVNQKLSQAIKKGKRDAAVALDDAIARAVAKERN